MAHTDFTTCAAYGITRRPGLRVSLVAAIDVWRSRRALAQLDSRALQDVGISAKAALAEERKPIWDVPAQWLK